MDKSHILKDLWTLTIVYAMPEEENRKRTDWENHLEIKFTKEIDRAARNNTQRNYTKAMIKAFQRTGIDIKPQWFDDMKISDETINEPYTLEEIWVMVHRFLQCKEAMKKRNREGREPWLQMLIDLIGQDEQIAQNQGKSVVDHSNAILYSLSKTGRKVNPDILKGLPTWHQESLIEQTEITDKIWELACLELDHETLEIEEQTKFPQKKKQKLWTKKLREYLYANLENIREKGIWLTNSKVIVEAFSEIGWNFKTKNFQEFNRVDPYALLYSNNQKEVWQKACSLREKPKKPKNISGTSCGSS